MKNRLLFAFSAFFLSFSMLFAQTQSPEPYSKDEFHPVLKDLRRAEIITLGAIPFVTFNVTLGYSFGKYASHNFDSNYFRILLQSLPMPMLIRLKSKSA